MNHFLNYSKYYNLLYQDKDYSVEVNYIDLLIKKNHPLTKTILDVGCGTGRHAKLMADVGYTVHGIDMSRGMLEIAKQSEATNLTFSEGDIRNFNLGQKFDTITALFHVMSYQTTNSSVIAALKAIGSHLNENGIFIFDCWYGPAVLLDLPGLRVKEMENEELKVIRITRPSMDYNNSLVEVNFEINVFDKATCIFETFSEKHPMRYFFLNELRLFTDSCGFNVIGTHTWLTTDAPGKNSWYITVICRRK